MNKKGKKGKDTIRKWGSDRIRGDCPGPTWGHKFQEFLQLAQTTFNTESIKHLNTAPQVLVFPQIQPNNDECTLHTIYWPTISTEAELPCSQQ